MKSKLLLFLFFTLSFSSARALLSGTANLSGQTNHTGIKVKFISNSGTSVTDSTVTNANGSYSINISSGIYKVVVSKAGYQSAYYNNNAAILLSNTTTLNTISLLPGTIINVSGAVSGTWSNTIIYVVNSDITIPTGLSLTILPGTVIKFNGNYSLTANGALIAVGNGSNKILFTSNNSNPAPDQWSGIFLYSSQSIVQNCIIEYCRVAIWISQSSPPIMDNELRHFFSSGVVLNMGSSSLVKHNTIHDFNSYDASSGITSYGCAGNYECNTIYDGAGYGIVLQDGSTVKNNLIYGIMKTNGGIGINCSYISSSRIENNVIHHCWTGINYGETVPPGPNPLIINNAIYNTTTAISSSGCCGTSSISNNIFAGNTNGIYMSSWALCPSQVSYNIFWNNSGLEIFGVPITGIGQVLNINNNGDSVDSYFNLFKNPLFINNTPPFYTFSSPCLGAGNVLYASYIGCNSAYLCADMITGIAENKREFNYKAWPNPFTYALQLKTTEFDKIVGIQWIDLYGRSFDAVFVTISETQLKIDGSDLAKGVYFLEIAFSKSGKQFMRVIKE